MILVAHSGVAAANLGGGAATIDSVFARFGDDAAADLDGTKLDNFADRWGSAKLLVIDEISTVGAAQFELMSRRLEQMQKVFMATGVWN